MRAASVSWVFMASLMTPACESGQEELEGGFDELGGELDEFEDEFEDELEEEPEVLPPESGIVDPNAPVEVDDTSLDLDMGAESATALGKGYCECQGLWGIIPGCWVKVNQCTPGSQPQCGCATLPWQPNTCACT